MYIMIELREGTAVFDAKNMQESINYDYENLIKECLLVNCTEGATYDSDLTRGEQESKRPETVNNLDTDCVQSALKDVDNLIYLGVQDTQQARRDDARKPGRDQRSWEEWWGGGQDTREQERPKKEEEESEEWHGAVDRSIQWTPPIQDEI